MPTIRWQPDRATPPPPWPVPPLVTAIARGLSGRCPACGKGPLFRGFLKIVRQCLNCGAPLGLARADDAPPYFSILITGHLVIPPLVLMERADNPPSWELAAIFLPLTALLSVGLLRPVKGAIVGVMLTMGMLKSGAQPE